MWKNKISIELLNNRGKNTMVDFLDIEFIEISDNYLVAKMPITDKVKQPIGIMNGGASCVLAESVGSTAGNYAVDLEKQYCVGLDINTNHIRPATSGFVYATAKPYHIGRNTHVWSIEIIDDNDKLISINRLTLMVRNR